MGDVIATLILQHTRRDSIDLFSLVLAQSDPLIHPLMREKIALVTAHKKSTEATLK